MLWFMRNGKMENEIGQLYQYIDLIKFGWTYFAFIYSQDIVFNDAEILSNGV